MKDRHTTERLGINAVDRRLRINVRRAVGGHAIKPAKPNRLISPDTKLPSVEHALKEVAEELTSPNDGLHAISLLEGYSSFLSERRSKIMRFLAAQ